MIMAIVVITAVIMMMLTVKLKLCNISLYLYSTQKNIADNVNNSLHQGRKLTGILGGGGGELRISD